MTKEKQSSAGVGRGNSPTRVSRTDKNILVAFILNLAFSVFEFIGGAITGSVAIVSDAVHDIGDAVSIGISYFLERKSKRAPDEKYTYGYARYSVMGSFITTVVLIIGSVAVICGSVSRLFNPVEINYDGMIILAIIGAVINFAAAWFTHRGDSLNQKSVNLHMLEDVLGWIVVLVGAIAMHFTDISMIDPLMSIGVAIFILVHALKNFGAVINLFLVKVPGDVSVREIEDKVRAIKGVEDVHHVHIWSIDGRNNYATMHVVVKKNNSAIKEAVRQELLSDGIVHVTLELETQVDDCKEKACRPAKKTSSSEHIH